MRNLEDLARQMRGAGGDRRFIFRWTILDGYSSLQHLHQLPIERLKIDRVVHREGVRAERDERRWWRRFFSLAHSLGLEVVAEGVDASSRRSAWRG